MAILRAAALVVLSALAAWADPPATVQCRQGDKTVEKPIVNGVAPKQCSNPARDVDAYSLRLLLGWKEQRDAQICICYFPSRLAVCQVARNFLRAIKAKETNGLVPCLAAETVGLYNEELPEVSAAVQSSRQ